MLGFGFRLSVGVIRVTVGLHVVKEWLGCKYSEGYGYSFGCYGCQLYQGYGYVYDDCYHCTCWINVMDKDQGMGR